MAMLRQSSSWTICSAEILSAAIISLITNSTASKAFAHAPDAALRPTEQCQSLSSPRISRSPSRGRVTRRVVVGLASR